MKYTKDKIYSISVAKVSIRCSGEYLEDRGYTHTGIDFANGTNFEILQCNIGGVVDYAGWEPSGFGNLIRVKLDDGNKAYYGHLSRIDVKVGLRVNPGTHLGLAGNTGKVFPKPTSQNPRLGIHLHFEVRNPQNKAIDPSKYLFVNNDIMDQQTLNNFVDHLYIYCLGRKYKPSDNEGKYWKEKYVGKSATEFFKDILSQPEFLGNKYWKESVDQAKNAKLKDLVNQISNILNK